MGGLGFDTDHFYDRRTISDPPRTEVLTGQEALDTFAEGVSRLLEGHTLHYKTDFQEIPVSVENRKGSVRKGGRGEDAWETKMKHPYGRIPGTKGADGDALDVYVGPSEDAAFVYIVHQKNPETGKFDEDKIMLGFDSEEEAKKAFYKHYDEPEKYFGSIDKLSMWAFKKKLDSGKGLKKITESFREYGVPGMKWGHHKSEKDLKNSVEKGGGVYKGVMSGEQFAEDLVLFNEPMSRSTLAIPISKVTTEAVEKKVAGKRREFDKFKKESRTRESRFREWGIFGMHWGVRHARKDTGKPRGEKKGKQYTNVSHKPLKGYHIDHESFLKKRDQYMSSHEDFLNKHPDLKRVLMSSVDPSKDFTEDNPKLLQSLLNKTASGQDQTAHTSSGLHKEGFQALKQHGWDRDESGNTQEIKVKGGAGFATPVISPTGRKLALVTVRGEEGFTHYVSQVNPKTGEVDISKPIISPKYVAIKRKETFFSRPEEPVAAAPTAAAPSPEAPVPAPTAPAAAPAAPVARHKRGEFTPRRRTPKWGKKKVPHSTRPKEFGIGKRQRSSVRESEFEGRLASWEGSVRLREARKRRVYYARSLKRFGTTREASEMDSIEEAFPDHDLIALEGCRKKAGRKDMGYFHDKVEEASDVVISPYRKNRISAGVWSEARHAMKEGIPVHLLRHGKFRRVRKLKILDDPDSKREFAVVITRKGRKSRHD